LFDSSPEDDDDELVDDESEMVEVIVVEVVGLGLGGVGGAGTEMIFFGGRGGFGFAVIGGSFRFGASSSSSSLEEDFGEDFSTRYFVVIRCLSV